MALPAQSLSVLQVSLQTKQKRPSGRGHCPGLVLTIRVPHGRPLFPGMFQGGRLLSGRGWDKGNWDWVTCLGLLNPPAPPRPPWMFPCQLLFGTRESNEEPLTFPCQLLFGACKFTKEPLIFPCKLLLTEERSLFPCQLLLGDGRSLLPCQLLLLFWEPQSNAPLLLFPCQLFWFLQSCEGSPAPDQEGDSWALHRANPNSKVINCFILAIKI